MSEEETKASDGRVVFVIKDVRVFPVDKKQKECGFVSAFIPTTDVTSTPYANVFYTMLGNNRSPMHIHARYDDDSSLNKWVSTCLQLRWYMQQCKFAFDGSPTYQSQGIATINLAWLFTTLSDGVGRKVTVDIWTQKGDIIGKMSLSLMVSSGYKLPVFVLTAQYPAQCRKWSKKIYKSLQNLHKDHMDTFRSLAFMPSVFVDTNQISDSHEMPVPSPWITTRLCIGDGGAVSIPRTCFFANARDVTYKPKDKESDYVTKLFEIARISLNILPVKRLEFNQESIDSIDPEDNKEEKQETFKELTGHQSIAMITRMVQLITTTTPYAVDNFNGEEVDKCENVFNSPFPSNTAGDCEDFVKIGLTLIHHIMRVDYKHEGLKRLKYIMKSYDFMPCYLEISDNNLQMQWHVIILALNHSHLNSRQVERSGPSHFFIETTQMVNGDPSPKSYKTHNRETFDNRPYKGLQGVEIPYSAVSASYGRIVYLLPLSFEKKDWLLVPHVDDGEMGVTLHDLLTKRIQLASVAPLEDDDVKLFTTCCVVQPPPSPIERDDVQFITHDLEVSPPYTKTENGYVYILDMPLVKYEWLSTAIKEQITKKQYQQMIISILGKPKLTAAQVEEFIMLYRNRNILAKKYENLLNHVENTKVVEMRIVKILPHIIKIFVYVENLY